MGLISHISWLISYLVRRSISYSRTESISEQIPDTVQTYPNIKHSSVESEQWGCDLVISLTSGSDSIIYELFSLQKHLFTKLKWIFLLSLYEWVATSCGHTLSSFMNSYTKLIFASIYYSPCAAKFAKKNALLIFYLFFLVFHINFFLI